MNLLNTRRIVFVLAAIVFIITAINSHGYNHGDEHFQIIEFSGLKLGTTSPAELAWEFDHQMRPSLQPTICYFVLSATENMGITNPYSQVLVLRLLTAILALFTIRFFVQNTIHFIKDKKAKLIYLITSYFLWFIPFLNVRFCSETWSSLFFMLALSLILKERKNKFTYYIIGSLIALSFLFRYQMAFAILGLLSWLIFINKTSKRKLAKIIIAFSFLIVCGFLNDSWFYGNYVFAPWNYFYVNIVEDVASSFGTHPWYYYFLKIVISPGFITGIPILLSMVLLVYLKPKNIFMWCIIPYFMVHSIIPHKEDRFLFFILYLSPIIVFLTYQILEKKINKNILVGYMSLLVIVNAIGVVVMTQKSAGIGRIELTKYINEHYPNVPLQLIHTSNSNPYIPWDSIRSKFYEQDNIEYLNIETIDNLNPDSVDENRINLLVIQNIESEGPQRNKLNQLGFVKIKSSIPKWIQKLNQWYRNFYKKNHETLELYYHQPIQSDIK